MACGGIQIEKLHEGLSRCLGCKIYRRISKDFIILSFWTLNFALPVGTFSLRLRFLPLASKKNHYFRLSLNHAPGTSVSSLQELVVGPLNLPKSNIINPLSCLHTHPIYSFSSNNIDKYKYCLLYLYMCVHVYIGVIHIDMYR